MCYLTQQEDSKDNQRALDVFRAARFQGILVRPPKIITKDIPYEELFNQERSTEVVPKFGNSFRFSLFCLIDCVFYHKYDFYITINLRISFLLYLTLILLVSP